MGRQSAFLLPCKEKSPHFCPLVGLFVDRVGRLFSPHSTLIWKKIKKQIADEAFALVENQIRNYPEIIGLEFGGSYAKDTWLSREADIDIFIKFKTMKFEDNMQGGILARSVAAHSPGILFTPRRLQ